MSSLAMAAASALWFGILTSVSPCPLATNITAISFVSRKTGSPVGVLLTGLLYTVGRALVYVAIAMLLVTSLLSAPAVSLTLQMWMNKLLGPILILVGMVMLGLVRIRFRGRGMSERLQHRVEGWGLLGALALGMLFALSFCPVSATLFFGSLLPLALNTARDSCFLCCTDSERQSPLSSSQSFWRSAPVGWGRSSSASRRLSDGCARPPASCSLG